MRLFSRAVVLFSVLAWLSSTLAGQGSAEDLAALMKEIRRTQREDFESWARYSFDRHVVRRRIDGSGAATRTEILEFEVTASQKGFDETLVRINGRKPLASEVREHRRASRFSKHYGQVRAGGDVDQHEGFSLAWLVQFPSYRLKGIERIRGTECYRLDFEPGMTETSGTPVSRVPGRFVEAMGGSLWIARGSHHIVRARARTVQPVRMSFGVVRIMNLEVALDAGPVAQGAWLPERISVRSHLLILGRDVRKENIFNYSRFRERMPE
jgi:hypothetical protein